MSSGVIIAYSDPWKAGEKFKKEVLRDKKKAKQMLLKFLKSALRKVDSIDLNGKTIVLDDVTEDQASQWWKEWFK